MRKKHDNIGKIAASTRSMEVWSEEISEDRKRSLLPVKICIVYQEVMQLA